jgi:hypothetical protein
MDNDILEKSQQYEYPTPYNSKWQIETETVRDIFWKADKYQRREWARKNPCIFAEQYIKPTIRLWTTPIAKHQYYMMWEALNHKNIVIHIPVEHAKSTYFSLVLPLWFLINDKNTHGAIISNTATQAKGFLAAIKEQIETNEFIKQDFPELKPDYKGKWAETEIKVMRDMHAKGRDPTIIARGTGNAILGARFEWVIADDLCDLDNTANDIQREKTLAWWNEIVDSRVISTGRKIVLGTLQHNKDLLCTLSANKFYKYIHLQGYQKHNDACLWPEQWPKERLMEKKETIGTLAWQKVIQNDRTESSSRLLDPNWLNYYGHDQKFNFNIYSSDTDVYLGIDPAIAEDRDTAEKRKLDKFALAVVGIDKVSKLCFLHEYVEDWLTFPQQLKVIDQYYEKYPNCKKIGVESVAYQKALAQAAFIRQTMPPIVEVKVGQKSKAARIESFAVYSETKRFWIKKEHNSFIDEWIEFEPGGKSPNILDACCVCMTMIKGVSRVSDICINIKEHKGYKSVFNW